MLLLIDWIGCSQFFVGSALGTELVRVDNLSPQGLDCRLDLFEACVEVGVETSRQLAQVVVDLFRRPWVSQGGDPHIRRRQQIP
jgi:hypothetical protein